MLRTTIPHRTVQPRDSGCLTPPTEPTESHGGRPSIPTHNCTIFPISLTELLTDLREPRQTQFMHFLLSHMAVHHLHHLHYHRLHLLLLAQYFILNSRLGSSANPFLHRPFSFLPDWLHGLSGHLTILLCSTAGLVSVLDNSGS